MIEKIEVEAHLPIEFGNETKNLDIELTIEEKLLGALSNVTENTIKHATNVLFQADCETHNARNVLEIFQQPLFIPDSIKLKAKLQRGKIWMRKVSETQRALDREFNELNSKYASLAKAIMLKDKIYLVGLAQENSKQLTLQQILRVVECTYPAHIPVHRTSTLLGINNPITLEASTVTSTAAVARNRAMTLGIGFAFLLLFVNDKQSLPLTQYMGKTQASILDRASNFVLSPKPIDNSPGLVKDSRIRIGKLTFF